MLMAISMTNFSFHLMVNLKNLLFKHLILGSVLLKWYKTQ